MQAVDLAEMGVVYYKSAFIKKANGKLVPAIEAAIDDIKNENEYNKVNNINVSEIPNKFTNHMATLKYAKNRFFGHIFP